MNAKWVAIEIVQDHARPTQSHFHRQTQHDQGTQRRRGRHGRGGRAERVKKDFAHTQHLHDTDGDDEANDVAQGAHRHDVGEGRLAARF